MSEKIAAGSSPATNPTAARRCIIGAIKKHLAVCEDVIVAVGLKPGK